MITSQMFGGTFILCSGTRTNWAPSHLQADIVMSHLYKILFTIKLCSSKKVSTHNSKPFSSTKQPCPQFPTHFSDFRIGQQPPAPSPLPSPSSVYSMTHLHHTRSIHQPGNNPHSLSTSIKPQDSLALVLINPPMHFPPGPKIAQSRMTKLGICGKIDWTSQQVCDLWYSASRFAIGKSCDERAIEDVSGDCKLG